MKASQLNIGVGCEKGLSMHKKRLLPNLVGTYYLYFAMLALLLLG